MQFSSSHGPRVGAVLLISALVATPAFAQEIVLDRYYVNEPPLASGTTADVPGTTVRSHLPIDVGALLGREVAGLAPVRRGGVASDFLLRGLGRDNVMVAIDGAPAHAACPGRMDPPVFHVSSPLIEHIVIDEGPFNVRTSGAPGGAISVQSASAPDHAFATAGALAGSADLETFDAAVGGPVGGGWRALVAGSYEQGKAYCDGNGVRVTAAPMQNYRGEFRDGRAFSIVHAEANAAWRNGAGRELQVRAALNDGRDVLYPALMMDAQKDRATRVGATWKSPAQLPWADRWRIDVYHHRVQHDMSDAFRTSSLGMFASRGWMMRTVAETTNYGAQAEAEAVRGDVTWTSGVQTGARQWVADNTMGAVANAMIPDVTIGNAAAYVQAERATAKWKLRTGLRIDGWHSRAAREIGFVQRAQGTSVNGRNDAAAGGHVLVERRMSEAASVFAGIGRGARLPDPQERYISVDRPGTGTDWVGNPRLGVVHGSEVTLGLRANAGAVRLTGRAYYLRLEDCVVLGRLVPAVDSTANRTRTESYFGIGADITGAELRAEVPLWFGWTASADAAGQAGRKRTLPPVGTDRDLAEIPPWRGNARLRWEHDRVWFEAAGQWAARQSKLDSDSGERPVAGYVVGHVRLEYQLTPQVALSTGIENVFNRTYVTHNAYTRDPFAAGMIINDPGRFAYVQIRWRL